MSQWAQKIISGGQTGVDRAALDVALASGHEVGGWCPHGRRAENGPIPERYPLRETASEQYPPRTALNVRDSDATLVLYLGAPDKGARLAETIARRSHKPSLSIDLADRDAYVVAREWLRRTAPKVLNVAGPREGGHPGVYARAYGFLARLLND